MKHTYSKLKIFHYKEKIDSLPKEISEILSPIHVRIKPTNVCAHNCWYCAYKADGLQLGQDMVKRDYIPEGKMQEIIEDLVAMDVKAVTFSGGGDPFYYPYLLKTVQQLAKTPIHFASLTNGARLEGELAEVFAHSGTWIRISIDAWDDESYAAQRGVPQGEFTKVMKNMEQFKKQKGGCALGVSLIVHKDNAGHVFDFVKRLKSIGVDSVKISPCIVSNDGMESNQYHRPFLNNVKEHIRKVLAELADNTFEVFDACHELDEKFNKDYTWCPYLQLLPVIGADLNIYPCQDKAYNLEEGLIGSIKNKRFKDFWFTDKTKFFKINPAHHCSHHCVANLKNKCILEYLNADKEHLGFV